MAVSTTPWNDKTLSPLRQIMDKKADDVVNSIYGSESSDFLRTALMKIASNDSSQLKDYFPENAKNQALYDLVNGELTRKFSSADTDMFATTNKVWMEKGVEFIFVLFFRALPFTYAAEKPANVLRMTKLIENQTIRRVFETAQFVFDVMDEDWWTPGKRGIITAFKIRIMHGAMRYMLLKGEGDQKWNGDAWGMPISQEDLIATNQVFSLEFFKGAKMISDPLTQDEQDAWFHTWKVIGGLMGVQSDLLMPTVDEAWELQTAIYQHLFTDKIHDSGIGLAKALVGALTKFMLSEKLVLILMKEMMKDDGFPDVFDKLLGPSYKDVYPELFTSGPANNGHAPQINDGFIEEVKAFYTAAKKYRDDEVASQPTNGSEPPAKNAVDDKLEEIRKVFDDTGKSFFEKLEEDIIEIKDEIVDEVHKIFKEDPLSEEKKKIMKAISVIIIYLLSKYFREDKQSQFRMDANLKEHWSIQ